MAGPLGNRYRIGASLGRGDAGEVFFGQGPVGDAYAIKILRPDLATDPKLVARVMGAQVPLLSVRTPHLTPVLDLVADGVLPAIVMELVPGGSLRHRLFKGPLPPQEVARLGSGIARGLAEVHAAGSVHSGLKPENVLIDYRDNPSRPRLTDVGLSRAVADTATVRVGSPPYRAPELWRGGEATAASDLYALGIVLYEMACGVTPYIGEQVALMERHLTYAPGRPAGIADWLWTVITELTALHPHARGESASSIARRLELLVPLLVGTERPARILTPPPGVRRQSDGSAPKLARPQPPKPVAKPVSVIAAKPTPVAEKPAPVVENPAPPVVVNPAPAMATPPPVAGKPPPVVATPVPTVAKPDRVRAEESSRVPKAAAVPRPSRAPEPEPEPLRRPAVSRVPEQVPTGTRSGLLAGAAALVLLVGGGALWAAGGEDGASTAYTFTPQVPVVVAPASPTPSALAESPTPSPKPTSVPVPLAVPVRTTGASPTAIPSPSAGIAAPRIVACEPFRAAPDGGLTRTVRPADASGRCRVDVRMIQSALGVSPANGTFGPQTQAAVRAYQLKRCPSYPQPGVIDRWTWDSIVRGQALRCPSAPLPAATPTPTPRPMPGPTAVPTSDPEPTVEPTAESTPTPSPRSTPTRRPTAGPTAAATSEPPPPAESSPPATGRPTSSPVPTSTPTPGPVD